MPTLSRRLNLALRENRNRKVNLNQGLPVNNAVILIYLYRKTETSTDDAAVKMDKNDKTVESPEDTQTQEEKSSIPNRSRSQDDISPEERRQHLMIQLYNAASSTDKPYPEPYIAGIIVDILFSSVLYCKYCTLILRMYYN